MLLILTLMTGASPLAQPVGGLYPGLITGAKALFCLTALIILAGEKENIPGGLASWKLAFEWGREGESEGATRKTKSRILKGITTTR